MIKIKKTMKHGKLLLVLLTNIGLFYSCVPTKELKQENNNLPNHYAQQSTDTTNSAIIKWKDFFKDDNLIKLIDTALVNNQ